jgi:hypothetical protein
VGVRMEQTLGSTLPGSIGIVLVLGGMVWFVCTRGVGFLLAAHF